MLTGVMGSQAAKGAASDQRAAANQASNTQMQMYNQTRGDLAPYNRGGQAAFSQLGSIYGLPGYKGMSGAALSNMLTNLPGYQFQMGQGTQAIDRSAAARGRLTSGATGKALTQFGQGLAGSYLNNYVGGLTNMAGLGESAGAQTGAMGIETGRGVAASQVYGGNASAAGQVGAANAWTGAFNQGMGLYGLYQGGFFGQPGAGANGVSSAGGAAGAGAGGGGGAYPYYTTGGVWGSPLANSGPWGPAWTPWSG